LIPWFDGAILSQAWKKALLAKFRHGNEETLWFARLLSVWNDLRTFAILTRASNDIVTPIHYRMPVILDSAEREDWLSGSDRTDLGAAYRGRSARPHDAVMKAVRETNIVSDRCSSSMSGIRSKVDCSGAAEH
jgi:putative SOS response-associated peptidase YedK